MSKSHHRGLGHDLKVMAAAMNRRQMLRLTAGASVLAVLGCSDDGAGATDGSTGGSSGGDSTGASSGDDPTTGGGSSSGGPTTVDPTTGGGSSGDGTTGDGTTSGTSGDGTSGDGTTSDGTTGDGVCSEIPSETGGPYPGDGTNGANALVLAGIVRSDIRKSIAGASGTAEGVPLTVVLRLVDESCAALAGRAIYAWHCDRAGDYSLYTGAAKAENYLRGVQETDAKGEVTFVSIFPACYSGRWPHIHFEIFPDLASATSGKNAGKTTQLALPEDACDEAFAVAGYEASVKNFAQISLQSDNVFSDGSSLQVAEVTGSVDDGYVATLTVTIKG